MEPLPPSRLLDGLNPAQVEAVTSTASPLCILAGAGSGKTRVLTRRIAWRAEVGDLDPRHVLALTFTRKAAGELTSRLRALGLREQVAAGTFHAIAYAQLRTRWAERDIAPPVLMTRKVGFVAQLLTASERSVPAIDFVAEIEWAKARMVDPDRYPAAASAAGRRPPISFEAAAAVYDRYESERRARRMIDFDDMLRVCLRDLEADDGFAASQRWRFAHLFVDEFQDVNPLQHALLEAWRDGRPDLCVVGDPNQAIYSWNGADPDLIRTFAARHPGAAVVRLTDNHRSTPQILAVANALLVGGRGVDHEGTQIATRGDGPVPVIRDLPDERAEAVAIARSVRDHHGPGARWSAQAVLVRINAQLPIIEEAMRDSSIPFRVRGAAPLLDQPEIKAALAELRRTTSPLADALHDLALSIDLVDPSLDTDLATQRRANLDALVQLGRDYLAVEDPPTIPGFLTWLTATTRADQPDPSGDAVELLTFHAAKGLEWPVVHLAGLEQGYLPINHAKTAEAWAEERRLFYVATTRAERELRCTWARTRRFGERAVPRDRSEFLDAFEIACDALEAGIDPAAVGKGARATGTGARAERRPTGRPRSGGAGRTRSRPATYPEGLDREDRDLFDALRAWRSERSKEADVPAFVVCNDHTLAEIARTRPTTPVELRRVNGMGEIKVSRFGDEILAVIADND